MRRRSQLHETLGWLLLTLAVFLCTLPDLAAESRGVKRVEIKTAAGEAIGLYEQSHALVIGVSAYEHWPKLLGVKRDVTDVAAALEKNDFAVQTVLVLIRTCSTMPSSRWAGWSRARHGRSSVSLSWSASPPAPATREGGCALIRFD